MKRIFALAFAFGLLLQTGSFSSAEAHEPTCYDSGNTRRCIHEDHSSDAALGALLVVGVVAGIVVVAVIASGEEKKTPVSTSSLVAEAEPGKTSLQPFYDMEQGVMGVKFGLKF